MFNNIAPVTKNLIIINVMVYVFVLIGMQTGIDYNNYLASNYVMTPNFQPYQIVTHMFAHDEHNLLHIFFNMFLLASFGSILERMWGAKRFFIFYVASGLGAYALYNGIGVYQMLTLKQELLSQNLPVDTLKYSLSEITSREINQAVNSQYTNNKDLLLFFNNESVQQYWSYLHSKMLGASGAVFGVLAAFMILFPNTQLQLLFPPIPIKAKYLIGGYLVYEIYNGLYNHSSDIAHWAHVGGAIVGIAYVLYDRKFNKKNFY